MSTSSRRRRSRRSQRAAPHFMPEPIVADYTQQYSYIRRDLIRILLWGAGLIALMVALSLANVLQMLTSSL